MNLRRSALSGLIVLAVVLQVVATDACAEPLGTAPTYTTRVLSEPPNAAAISTRIWAPGLDEGYVPQGLTFAEGAIFLGTYR
ncbi:MAG TPA: hypothetical protein PK264_04395, partial [Hyphomicrobiaceae bacterium]|nr:hypothetical protein [Hyphomicrobiaceae bacterium]